MERYTFFAADDDLKGYELCELSPLDFNDTFSVNNNITATANVKKQTAWLKQNSPNPFSNTTNIQYTLPQNYCKASLIFRNLSGSIIKTISLSGSGIKNIDVTNLSSGIYFYSLAIDDVETVTKKCEVIK